MKTGRNTVEILTAAALPYLLTTAKDIQWEKVSVSRMQNLRTTMFGNTLTTNDKYFLLGIGNLLQNLQMQLSEKEKTFSDFLFAF